MRIYKYQLEITDRQYVTMPVGAEILSVQTQFDKPTIWALIDKDEELEERHFRIIGTGHNFTEFEKIYIGTFQTNEGQFVGHLFEITNGSK